MDAVISYLIFEESHKFIVYLPFRLFSIMDATPSSVPPVSEILKTATSITGDSTGAVVLRVKEHRNHLKSYTTVQRAQLISTLKTVVFHDKPGQWNYFLSKYLMPALSASIQYFIFS